MIAHYYISYNENPKTLARKVRETMTVTVRNAHQKDYQEEVNEGTIFHLFSGKVMPLAQFLEEYGDEETNS